MMTAVLFSSLGIFLFIERPLHDYIKSLTLQSLFVDEGNVDFVLNYLALDVQYTLNIYVFNATNHDDFLRGNAKYKVQEVGPYVVQGIMKLNNVTFNHTKGVIRTVPSLQITSVTYPANSAASSNDTLPLIMPDIIMLACISYIEENAAFARFMFNWAVDGTNSEPFVAQSAQEFLFTRKSKLGEWIETIVPNILPASGHFGILEFAKWEFNSKERSKSLTFATGENNAREFGTVKEYNDAEYLSHWGSESCNRIFGTCLGLKTPTNLAANETVRFWLSPLCRTIPLVPVAAAVDDDTSSLPLTHSIKGVPVNLYKYDENMFDNGEYDAHNKCYCRKKDDCPARGLADMSPCFKGIAVAASGPHFYNSDPKLSKPILGLNPQKHLHESFAYINQEIGVFMNFKLRFQLNLVMGNIKGYGKGDAFANMTVPVFWFEVELRGLPILLHVLLFMVVRGWKIVELVIAFALCLAGLSPIYRELSNYWRRRRRHPNNGKNQQRTGIITQCANKYQETSTFLEH